MNCIVIHNQEVVELVRIRYITSRTGDVWFRKKKVFRSPVLRVSEIAEFTLVCSFKNGKNKKCINKNDINIL